MGSSEKVAALVVTWNRKDLLRRCLQALQAQSHPLHAVIVVDNASTDGTEEMLRADFPQVQVRRMETNTGGAGGFHEAIRLGLELPVEDLWLMDDDAWASPDALEQLLNARREIFPSPAFVCSRVVADQNQSVNVPAHLAISPVPSWDRYLDHGYLPVHSCSFVSALIPRDNALKAGLPLFHYFIWLDDTEYTLRLSDRNPGWYVATSMVHHPRPSGQSIPDLKTESNPQRFALYRHFYANYFETHLRHHRRFGRGWIVGYVEMILRDSWAFLRGRQWDRLAILLLGLGDGLARGIRFRFASRRGKRALTGSAAMDE